MTDSREQDGDKGERNRPLIRARSMTLWTLLSRIFGLARDLLFAAFFGAGMYADALKIAFRIPNLLRDLLAEGALSNAFVPAYLDQREKRGSAAAAKLAGGVFTLLSAVVSIIVIVGIIFAPEIIGVVVPGFSEGEDGSLKVNETIELTRWLLPFILLVSWIAIFRGLLNSRNIFGLPAAQPVLANVVAVSAGIALLVMVPTLAEGARIWAAALLAGGVVGVLMLLPAVRTADTIRFQAKPWSSGMARVLRQMLILGLASAAAQVNIVINSGLASRLGTGGVSWLDYAFRLYYLPIGLIGVALGVVILVDSSVLVARGDIGSLRKAAAENQRMNLFIGLPAAIGLAILAEPIISTFLERGAFGPEDTWRTAEALVLLAIGVPFACMTKGLLPICFALQREKLATISTFFAVISNLTWVIPMASPSGPPAWAAKLGIPGGIEALALGTSIAAASQWLVLQIGLWSSAAKIPFPAPGRFFPLSLIAVALAATCWGVKEAIAIFEFSRPVANAGILLTAIPLSMALVIFLGKALRLGEATALLEALTHPRRQAPGAREDRPQ